MMLHSHAMRLAWSESVEQFRENLPWAMIALAIVVATCIVVFLFVTIGEKCCRSKRDRARRMRAYQSAPWVQSLGRVLFLILAALIAAGGFWIAATTFGVSFWNIIFSYGIVTLFIGQIFGTSLRNLGAYIQIVFTAKLVNDMYVEFVRLPIKGKVINMNISCIELERQDGRIVQIPTQDFIAEKIIV